MTALPVDSAQLADLWYQVRSVAEERSKDFGDVALQYHLAEQLGLVALLDRVAGKRDQGISVGQAMVLMAIHRNSDPGSKVSLLEWYPTTALPELSGLPAEMVSYSDLLSSMDYWPDEAIGQVETELTLAVGQRFHLRLHTLAWDSSSCYFEGQTNELVQYGYSRDHRSDCPQIGTDLFVDVDHGWVSYGRSYEGNETDVERFPQALMDLRSQYPDDEDVTILMDRGPASEDNLVLLRELGYGVIAGVPLKGQWATRLERVRTFEMGFNLNGTRYAAQRQCVYLQGHRFYLHIYYHHKRAKEEQKRRQQAMQACQQELERLRLGQYKLKTREQIRTRVDTILQAHKVKTFLSVKVVKPRGQEVFHLEIQPRKRALAKAQRRDGRFALITQDKQRTAKEVLIEYRRKNQAESAFSIIKGPISLRPVFHFTPARIKAHVFICHLALLLRNLLNLLLQIQEIDLTPQKALKTVKRLHLTEVYFPQNGQLFWLLNQIDPEVQQIFDAVGLNPQHLLESTGLSPPVTSND
jgi:transposase